MGSVGDDDLICSSGGKFLSVNSDSEMVFVVSNICFALFNFENMFYLN